MSVSCTKFLSYQHGTLQGFADLRIDKWGLELIGCTLHMKDGKRWINMPSKEISDKNTGQKKYINLVRFSEPNTFHRFQEAAKRAIDEWCAGKQKEYTQE